MPTENSDALISKIRFLTGCSPNPPVLLCIGSDRVTGDAFGPFAGHILSAELNVSAYVYGTLTAPVTALNLVETLSFIKANHKDSLIIAIDSSLGAKDDVGSIRVLSDGIYPGAADGKTLPKVGDAAITATVAESGGGELYGVRLGFVYFLAKTVAEALARGLERKAS
ncbi:MAG: spore protease YyaC [Clostridiales bacterium]|jgi:putative sporulation protein YyaC|nr:spore protease YyaC [Clostridiales bacterium]